jgi:hypothetical protein
VRLDRAEEMDRLTVTDRQINLGGAALTWTQIRSRLSTPQAPASTARSTA